MVSTLSKFAAAVAVAGLALAQPVAAATRAADSLPSVAVPVDRMGSPVKKRQSEEVGTLVGVGGAWFIVTAVVIVAGIIVAVELDEEDASPGT